MKLFKIALMFFAILSLILISITNPFANPLISNMTGIAILLATLWMTEIIPFSITSILPIILFPLFGITSTSEVASEYFNSTIFLFMGGFIIAIAMEKWGLHKRIALTIIKFIGTSPISLIIGFIISTFIISMFISNTATTIMMLPIGLAITKQLSELFTESQQTRFATALMLSIAYASSLGGVATLIGTVPNLIFSQIYVTFFPDAEKVTFVKWIIYALPIALTMVVFLYITIYYLYLSKLPKTNMTKDFINTEKQKLGKITKEETYVLIILCSTALLWLTRSDIIIFETTIKGWTNIFNTPTLFDDGFVALIFSTLLFMIPTKDNKTIMTNKDLFRIPWDIILLFGGGFALAKGIHLSGLATTIAESMKGFNTLPPFLIVLIISCVITFLTELTSNTATVTAILPILAALAISTGINPLLVMLPATISASFAFMLPVATPPNAIVFASGQVKMYDMMKVGIILNTIGIFVVSTYLYLVIK